MFFSSDHLICMGPPFYSFGNPLMVKREGKKLRFKIYPRHDSRSPSVILVRIDQPRSCSLEFVFQDWTIKVSYIHKPFPLTKTMPTAVIHQKDNFPVWIKDWCSYHSRSYGVERIFLYDNGSKYWTDLASILTGLGENLEIVLVNWPYKFGFILSHYKISWYKYGHPGALGHYHLAFGNRIKWCINLDIDEYLHLNSSKSLKAYLASKATQPVIPLYRYQFPMSQMRVYQKVRFYHQQYRYKTDYWPKEKGLKYVCQPTKVLAMDVHHSRLYTPKLLMKTILFKQSKLFWLRIFLYQLWVYLLIFSFWRLKRQEKRHIFNTNQANKNPLYHFHFCNLYTGWAGRYKKIDPKLVKWLETIPSEQLISDRRVIDKAVEKGMIRQSGVPLG